MSFKMRIVWRALVWYTWRLGRYYLLLHITTDRTQGRTDNEISDWTMRNWDVDTQWSQVRLTSSSSCCQSEIPTKSCLAVSRNNQRQITTVDRRTIVGRDVYIVRLTLEINETFEGLLTVVLWSQFTAIIVNCCKPPALFISYYFYHLYQDTQTPGQGQTNPAWISINLCGSRVQRYGCVWLLLFVHKSGRANWSKMPCVAPGQSVWAPDYLVKYYTERRAVFCWGERTDQSVVCKHPGMQTPQIIHQTDNWLVIIATC